MEGAWGSLGHTVVLGCHHIRDEGHLISRCPKASSQGNGMSIRDRAGMVQTAGWSLESGAFQSNTCLVRRRRDR